jgi:hypothetical protein
MFGTQTGGGLFGTQGGTGTFGTGGSTGGGMFGGGGATGGGGGLFGTGGQPAMGGGGGLFGTGTTGGGQGMLGGGGGGGLFGGGSTGMASGPSGGGLFGGGMGGGIGGGTPSQGGGLFGGGSTSGGGLLGSTIGGGGGGGLFGGGNGMSSGLGGLGGTPQGGGLFGGGVSPSLTTSTMMTGIGGSGLGNFGGGSMGQTSNMSFGQMGGSAMTSAGETGTQGDQFKAKIRDGNVKVMAYNCMDKYSDVPMKYLRLKDYMNFKNGQVVEGVKQDVVNYINTCKNGPMPQIGGGFGAMGGMGNNSVIGNFNSSGNKPGGLFGGGNPTGGLGGTTGGGLFGGGSSTGMATGGLGGGLFGGGGQSQPQGGGLQLGGGGGGLFGGGGQAQPQGGGLFGGGGQPQQQGGGLFGGGGQAQPQGGGLFGGGTTQSGGGLFGGSQGGQTTGGGLFGGGGTQQGGGLFGGGGQPQQQGGGLFGGGGQSQQQGGGLFGGGGQVGVGMVQGGNQPIQYVQPMLAGYQQEVVPQGQKKIQITDAGGNCAIYYVPLGNDKPIGLPENLQRDLGIGAGSTPESGAPREEQEYLNYMKRQDIYSRNEPERRDIDYNPLASLQCINRNAQMYRFAPVIKRSMPKKEYQGQRSALGRDNKAAPQPAISVFSRNGPSTLLGSGRIVERAFKVMLDNGSYIEKSYPENTQMSIVLRNLIENELWEPKNLSKFVLLLDDAEVNLMKSLAECNINESSNLWVTSKYQKSEGTGQTQGSTKVNPPKLTRRGYFTKPDYQTICRMTAEELTRVENFTIYNEFVKVVFSGCTNVTGIDIDETIILSEKSADMYPEGTTKPARGEGLNKTATITYYRFRVPLEESKRAAFMKKIAEWNKKNNTELVGVDTKEDSVTILINP